MVRSAGLKLNVNSFSSLNVVALLLGDVMRSDIEILLGEVTTHEV